MGFSALRESQKRYVFSGENVIKGDLGGEISSVAANHSLTLQNAVFGAVCPAVCPGCRVRTRRASGENRVIRGEYTRQD